MKPKVKVPLKYQKGKENRKKKPFYLYGCIRERVKTLSALLLELKLLTLKL